MTSEIAKVLSSLLLIVLGAFLGSLGTVLIERKKHKYSLQKEYFNNKLKVSEEIASLCQKGSHLSRGLERLFTTLPDAVKNGTFESYYEVMKSNTLSDAERILETIRGSSYSWGLYFDSNPLDQERVDSLMNQFMDSCTALYHLRERADANEINDDKKEEEARRILNDICSFFKSIYTLFDTIIVEIRGEMKKYEP